MYNSVVSVNTVMGLMSHLSASELKEILNNDEKFEQYAEELKPVSYYDWNQLFLFDNYELPNNIYKF